MNEVIYQEVINHCSAIMQERLQQIQTSLRSSEEALFSDTKSSAGDKYETSREMIQQDLDRLQKQLAEATRDKEMLESIANLPAQASTPAKRARLGSLVVTDSGNYFLGVGIGKVQIDSQVIFAISLKSPIGQVMLGKATGESFTFQHKTHTITRLL